MLDALERDLPALSQGTRDPQALRDEIERLRRLLESPGQRHHTLRAALHDLRLALDEGMEGAVAEGVRIGQYISMIGRILGM